MRKHLITAYSEDGRKLFIRYVSLMSEALKEVLNHHYLAQVQWIEFRGHKYTISDCYRMANRTAPTRERSHETLAKEG